MVKILNDQLSNLIEILKKISQDEYVKPINSLSSGTIGAHTRHIIEFVYCLTNQYESGIINYDLRNRDIEIENSVLKAISTINHLIDTMPLTDKKLQLSFTNFNHEEHILDTTYFREIVYNIEHCIHHEALLKVALLELGKETLLPKEFGVAPSTIHNLSR